LGGIPHELAHKAMKLASYKLPVKTKFITKITN
jgi:ribosomal protein L16/L10AE